MSLHDHYARLGVQPNASIEQIKSAYRRNATKFHPDRNPAPDAAARFREIQVAYEVLSDSEKRKAYDDYRQRSLIDDPLAVAQEITAKYLQGLFQ
ncbi:MULTISPECIES: DnaJ domain-containing protein [Deefgea]|uniref:J domain-containing protein n=1 Tax=Deefgea piscis TaxID=2739061 RepID=A0A6M8SR03_9NEIS|nr:MULTISPECIES: DnaJ domain-containing protein [Deefgea]MBM5574598.1 DnaJ domain-containing protein [Deefgea sp. CFH1-16]QKJ66558.1 J domain-containing protein [Deefgea piscis]QZA81722.1 DnaJ domain-containing protein [Deefgea piscis]